MLPVDLRLDGFVELLQRTIVIRSRFSTDQYLSVPLKPGMRTQFIGCALHDADVEGGRRIAVAIEKML